MNRVLIVDDEESICWGLSRLLAEEGYEVETAARAEDAFEAVRRRRPDLALFDIRLPGIDGLTALERIRASDDPFPVVVMTAYGNLETAVRAVRCGAFDYLTKPFDLDRAAEVVRRAAASGRRTAVAQSLQAVAHDETMCGNSPAMQETFKRIALAAPTDAPVLLIGASGTGKELAARAIHRYSHYSGGPFVPIHLAALSPTLIESELFGHARGAFTGAEGERCGLLEAADGGTVFFDEASDIPSPLQVKLLRVLEHHEVTRVGEVRPRPCRFRVVSAVNSDPTECVNRGLLRNDLYYRLAGFQIRLPALSERLEDVPLLAERFLAASSRGNTARFAPETPAALQRRSWPGNVRQLRNVVEQAAIFARGGLIEPEHLPPEEGAADAAVQTALHRAVDQWARWACAATDAQPATMYERLLAAVEAPLFDVVLQHTDGNRAAAADLLGIHRATLRKKLQQHDPQLTDDDETTSSTY